MRRGFSLIELLIVAAIMSLFFGGLFVTIQVSLKLVTDNRARMSALSVAGDKLEYIRSLSYDAVGTISGIPSGAIPQNSTSTLNGYLFSERTLIEYIDDPADGIGGADANGITTDYKRVKIQISWDSRGNPEEVTLVSTIIPRSIETNVGGGTIRVNVTNASVAPVAGASVRLVNNTGTTSIDVTKLTDSTGAVLFGGAPAGSGYEVFVTKSGYSTEQTYWATTTLPNPVFQPRSLLAADITTVDVQIDALSAVDVTLLTSRIEASINNTFATSSDISSSTNIDIQNESMALASSSGVYSGTGEAMTAAISPTSLARWQEIVITGSVPAPTSRRIRIYASTSPSSLIPDTDLPGNSMGFVTDKIDISGLNIGTYPELAVGVTLGTTDTATTSMISDIDVYYNESETPLSTNFTWHGTKIIGTLLDFSSVYKHSFATSTDSSGFRRLYDVEWDTYELQVGGYDIKEACPAHPFTVSPASVSSLMMILAPDTTNSLRVMVTAGGKPLRGATVTLFKSGTLVRTTSGCGQAFFSGINAESDYELTISAPGYSTIVISPFSISGDVVEEVAL